MILKEVSLYMLAAMLDVIEAEIGTLSFSFRLLNNSLEDVPLWRKWEHIYMHEATYVGYEPQDFAKEDIAGPESWEKGHYLRFPQTAFPMVEASAAIRWIVCLASGDSSSVILAMEELNEDWDPSEAITPLEHVLKMRTLCATT